jgi:hypothetical protein
VVRQQQHDIAFLIRWMRDFTEQQRRLVLVVATFLVGYRPSDLQRLVDEDVEDAARALAATLETSNRGVIYEHPATSATGSQLVAALKPVLAEARTSLPTTERDCALVLRRVEEGCREVRASAAGDRVFLEWLGRVVRPEGAAPAKADPAPRLIIP